MRGALGGVARLCACLCLCLAAFGCKTRPLVKKGPDGGSVDLAMAPPGDMAVVTSCRQAATNKVDILFMMDNSPSIAAMQSELKHRFPEFLQVFYDQATRGIAADLHIGVITSDYGAGATGSDNCMPSPGGQKGLLQAKGDAADPGCEKPIGASYISYQFGSDGSNNLPMGQDLNTTFSCMASVGSLGCGNEHPLEATYAALHAIENAGFVRDDAVLVIVFLTNEDDCSAPPDSDLFDNTKYADYGFAGNYRCTRFGVVCGSPPAPPPYGASGAPLLNCQPAPNPGGRGPGKLFDVSRYIDLFTQPKAMGGIKADPGDVVLVGIAAPSDPFQTILADPEQPWDGSDYMQCSPLNDRARSYCVPTLARSCQNPVHRVLFGDPAVRLNTVVRAARNHLLVPICDDDYTMALQGIATLSIAHLGACCLVGSLPPDPSQPAGVDARCSVEQLTPSQGGEDSVPILPCANNPGIFPCYRLQTVGTCSTSSPQSLGIVIDRDGAAAPDHATIQATCTPPD